MPYTTAQAAKAAGIQSNVTIRNYTRDARLIPFFSPTALTTPRQLTSEDVRLLKFIADATRRGETIPAVVKRLENKELTLFDWSPPDPEDRQDQDRQQRSSTALLDPNLTMLLQTLQAEFQAARAHSEQLQHELIQAEAQRLLAEQELARAEQELAQLKQRRSLWQRLTGR